MIKLIAILVFLTSIPSHAGLWCAMGDGMTPSEIAKSMSIPYQQVQIDKMNGEVIQVDIIDYYWDGRKSRVFKTLHVDPENALETISDIALGEYKGVGRSDGENDVVINVNEEGRIFLKIGPRQIKYACAGL